MQKTTITFVHLARDNANEFNVKGWNQAACPRQSASTGAPAQGTNFVGDPSRDNVEMSDQDKMGIFTRPSRDNDIDAHMATALRRELDLLVYKDSVLFTIILKQDLRHSLQLGGLDKNYHPMRSFMSTNDQVHLDNTSNLLIQPHKMHLNLQVQFERFHVGQLSRLCLLLPNLQAREVSFLNMKPKVLPCSFTDKILKCMEHQYESPYLVNSQVNDRGHLVMSFMGYGGHIPAMQETCSLDQDLFLRYEIVRDNKPNLINKILVQSSQSLGRGTRKKTFGKGRGNQRGRGRGQLSLQSLPKNDSRRNLHKRSSSRKSSRSISNSKRPRSSSRSKK